MGKMLCDHRISSIGLGTWNMGGGRSPDHSRDSIHVDAIKYALSRGINVIDTAEMYGEGHTEEIVGRAISGLKREDLFIISKVWSTHLKYDSVLQAARKSIERLKTPYIDLYLIHWPNPAVPIKETISAMEKLVEDGLVKKIGVSNFSVDQLKEAMEATSRYEICANQIEYSYAVRSPELEVIPFCEQNKIAVLAYTPIMKGHTKEHKKLEEVARKYGKSPVQIALRYVMERTIPIPKSSSKEHIDELIEASKINLLEEDYRFLTE